MKFTLSALVSTLFVSSALAQGINIGYPFDKAPVKAGSKITVEIDRPDTISSSEEVAVVIGLISCHGGTCPSPHDTFGTILYNGPYDPEFHAPTKPPHQNFTVKIPSSFSGKAQLAVFHVLLLGASLGPSTEIKNVTLNIN